MSEATTDKTIYPLGFPLDPITSKIIGDKISKVFLDTMWNGFFYYLGFFEPSVWYDQVTGSGTVTHRTGIDLNTGVTNPSTAKVITEFPGFPDFVLNTVNTHQRFRSVFAISATMTNLVAYIVRGNISDWEIYYGFKVINSTLMGVSQDDTGSEATVNLMTIQGDTNYDIEARFYPKEKIVFYVNGDIVGTLATKIPTSIIGLGEVRISTSTTADKEMTVPFFEYIQEK